MDQKMNSIQAPILSEWKCYMFGSKSDFGFVYKPPIDRVPNMFIRVMMRICLGCTWVKPKLELDQCVWCGKRIGLLGRILVFVLGHWWCRRMLRD